MRQPSPGRFEFISPTRHTHTVTPDPIGPTIDENEFTTGDPDPPNPANPDPPTTANPPQAADNPPF
jgi:hypothetical protein